MKATKNGHVRVFIDVRRSLPALNHGYVLQPLAACNVRFVVFVCRPHSRPLRACVEPQVGASLPRRSPPGTTHGIVLMCRLALMAINVYHAPCVMCHTPMVGHPA